MVRVRKVKEVASKIREISEKKEIKKTEPKDSDDGVEFVDNVPISSSRAVGAPTLSRLEGRSQSVVQEVESSALRGSREAQRRRDEVALYDARGSGRAVLGYAGAGSAMTTGAGARKSYKTAEDTMSSSAAGITRRQEVGRDFAMRTQRSGGAESRAHEISEGLTRERKEIDSEREKKYKWKEFE